MKSTPLKITFSVSGGWVPPPYPLHLDAVLAYAVTQRDLLDIEENPTVEALRLLGEQLPLAKFELEGEWVWQASAIVPESFVMNDSRFFTQRRDKADYAEAVRDGSVQHGRHRHYAPMTPYQYQIDTQRGVHRNLLGFYPVQRPMDGSACLKLVAWCVGDKDLIEDILQSDRCPTHLGARRRSGHGRIESVTVEELIEAKEGWKLRVRPWPFSENDAPVQAAWRAPYWAVENKGQAFMPAGL